MTGYFDQELSGLREDLIKMGRTVELNVGLAAEALIQGRGDLAEEAIGRDREVNAMENDITDRAILLIATRQPVAGDLRFLTAGLRLATEMERIGDQAANLGRRAKDLSALAWPWPPPEDLVRMIAEVRGMLESALDALVTGDARLSRTVLERDDLVDGLYRQIRREVISAMSGDGRKVPWGLEVINASAHLERLGDHATNLVEEVIFMVMGRNIRHQLEAVAAI